MSFALPRRRRVHTRRDTAPVITDFRAGDQDGTLPAPDLSVTEAMNKFAPEDPAGSLTPDPVRSSGPQQASPSGRPATDPRMAALPPTAPFTPASVPAYPSFTPADQQPAYQPAPHDQAARPVIWPLPPVTPMLFTARNPVIRRRQWAVARYRVSQMQGRYPKPDATEATGNAAGYAAAMRRYDRITGTSSPYSDPANWPVPVAPVVPNRQIAVTAGEQP